MQKPFLLVSLLDAFVVFTQNEISGLGHITSPLECPKQQLTLWLSRQILCDWPSIVICSHPNTKYVMLAIEFWANSIVEKEYYEICQFRFQH